MSATLDTIEYLPPYVVDEKGRNRCSWQISKERLINCSGVYVIKENGVIVYVGLSKVSVYKTAYRHFHKWKDSHVRYRVSYKEFLEVHKYEVAILELPYAECHLLEDTWIHSLQPRDNRDKLSTNRRTDYPEITKIDCPF